MRSVGRASREITEVGRVAAAGADATFELVPGGNHALLDSPRQWHGRASRAVLDLVG